MLVFGTDNADLICGVVDHALKNLDRGVVKDYRDNSLSPRLFREEFGTVRIQLARRMGHTTAAIRLLFANDDALLYVRPSEKSKIREAVNALSKLHVVRASMMERIITIGDHKAALHIKPVSGRSMIIIDGASTMTAHDKINILDSNGTARLIVELQ